MSGLEQWAENNEKYLTAALDWLKLRLTQMAASYPSSTPLPRPATTPLSAPPVPPAGGAQRRWIFRAAPPPRPVPESPAAAAPTPAPSAPPAPASGELKAREDAMNSAAAADPAPAMIVLQRRFNLQDFERFIVLLCVALELDTRIAALCARAQDDAAKPYPTFGLAFAMWPDPSWSALAPDGVLRYWRLIEINQPGSTPLMAAALRADEKIVNFVKGLNHLDDRLEPLLELAAPDAAAPAASHAALISDLVAQVQSASSFQRLPLFQLIGPDSSAKQDIASGVCESLGIQLFRIPAGMLPTQPAELETFTRLWRRETALAPKGLYVDAQEADAGLAAVHRFLARARGLIFCGLRDHQPGLGHDSVVRDVAKPTPVEQHLRWSAALGDQAGDAAEALAGQFNLNAREIDAIASAALADPNPGGASLEDRLWRACLESTRPRLELLAQRIEPKVTLKDVVLPKEQWDTLELIASQVRNRGQVYDTWGFRGVMNRGLGISALFAGESGTGKTMAAEALAADLRLNLYRIDLSAVVNKYLGETEKNLRRLFDAAEDGGAILFFDEADALFGKRSEVKDSHDRYANVEINYLLQRLEAFGGLAILATNMKSALDAAFTRRLRFIVNFPFPGQAEREAMWKKAFPPGTPVGELQYDRLAKLHLTGANIQSIAMHAAFLAAKAEDKTVTMQCVLDAARAEHRKFDWQINPADFRFIEPAGGKQ